jgi:hypothetical protein
MGYIEDKLSVKRLTALVSPVAMKRESGENPLQVRYC